MLRRAVAVCLASMAVASCANPSTGQVDAFARCVEDGGGSVADDIELVAARGRPLAVVGAVDADDDLISGCLDAVAAG